MTRKKRLLKWGGYSLSFMFIMAVGPLLALLSCSVNLSRPWYEAKRESTKLAPLPEATAEAVVQIYAARAYHWRGLFGVHMWIAIKEEKAQDYRIHQVIGWRGYRGQSVVVSSLGVPDRYWYGNKPEIIADLRGAEATKVIPQIEKAVETYPYANQYRIWPGPNSNTFMAHIGREVPDLELTLPNLAVGKDYLEAPWLARTPSGTGLQISIYGLFGVMFALKEGMELNILGLTFGFDFLRPALKLPGIGRLGWPPPFPEKPLPTQTPQQNEPQPLSLLLTTPSVS